MYIARQARRPPVDFRPFFLYKFNLTPRPRRVPPPPGLDHPETILMDKEPEPRARRRAARRDIDWHRGAELLAQGMSPANVAARLGCSRAALTRRRQHDPVFQAWMERCRTAGAELNRARFANLRPRLQEAIAKEVRDGNVRVVLWLADRLKLVTPPSEHTPDQELHQILNGLTLEELSEFEGLWDAP
jgi:hypothetical protein